MIADQEQEQKARVEFLQMAGQFLQQAVPLAQQVRNRRSGRADVAVRRARLPVGREMEAVF